MPKKSLQLLGVILQSLILVQSHGQRLRGRDPKMELMEREIRRESGFPVSFFDGEDNAPPSHYPEVEGLADSEEDFLPQPHPDQSVNPPYPEHRDDHPGMEDDSHDLFDPMEEGAVSPEHSVLGAGAGDAPAAAATAAAAALPAPGVKQDENPLNFLNLAGTDFQPGRMVNIFFGLMIMIFMIVIHGYILWIVGIAYLPGTRSLGDGWDVDTDVLFTLLTTVLDAITYWNDIDMQINDPPLNKD